MIEKSFIPSRTDRVLHLEDEEKCQNKLIAKYYKYLFVNRIQLFDYFLISSFGRSTSKPTMLKNLYHKGGGCYKKLL